MDLATRVVAPLVAVIVLAVQAIFDVTIAEDMVNEIVLTIVNVILVATAVIGVFTDKKKKKEAKATESKKMF